MSNAQPERNSYDHLFPPDFGCGNYEADRRFVRKILRTPSARVMTNAVVKEGDGDVDWQRS